MMIKVYSVLLTSCICLILVTSASGQSCRPRDDRDKFHNCTECLQEAGPGCGWCTTQDQVTRLALGCVPEGDCAPENLVMMETSHDVTNDTALGPDIDIHIQPQQVAVTIRPNIKHEFSFRAKKSENAVDIYFLLDVSGSMGDYKNELEQVPEKLIETLKKVTLDYQFGFGAFTEKPMAPMAPRKPYDHSFEHLVNMSKDTTNLLSQIHNTRLLPNWDTPEAGFDGLMQVILCGDKIGWRPDVTKIIVLITDAPQHISGDGIVGGMWRPYDHTCRLEPGQSAWVSPPPQAMVYPSLEYDYPSLSDINYWLDQKQMTLIFGTPAPVLPLYKLLVEEEVIYRAAAGDIGTDGTDLATIIAGEYNKIESSISISPGTFSPSGAENYVSVSLDSNCPKRLPGTEEDTVTCQDVTVKDLDLSFTATLEVMEGICRPGVLPANGTVSFDLRIFGQSNSVLRIDLKPTCECDCTQQTDDSICTSNGDLRAKNTCGACECDLKQGDLCECSKDGGNTDELEDKCRAGGEICSGNGECECGSCIGNCNSGFFGPYCGCELADLSGDRCGEDLGHGKSVCAQTQTQATGAASCSCNNGWSGASCECDLRQTECTDPITSLICNNAGSCDCNRCKCGDGRAGEWCQQNMAKADEETCNRLSPCILSTIFADSNDVDQSQKETWAAECEDAERFSCLIQFNETTDKNSGNGDGVISVGGDNRTDFGNRPNLPATCEVASPRSDLELKLCSVSIDSYCSLDVKHTAVDGLDSDEFYNTPKRVSVYVSFRNTTSSQPGSELSSEPEKQCREPVNLALVIGSAGGAGVMLFVIGFLSYCIVINIQDRREYKEFLKMQEDAWGMGDVTNSGLADKRESKRKSVTNRKSRVSFR